MFRAYVALLFLAGLAATVFGTLMPLGGGSTLAMGGAAALGASFVLIGIVLLGDRGTASASSR
ncbi:hypothetical protein [Microbacterium foliorum]|uniref:hypothetical protein n=1 Tax=Microbacterium foliorum TaxID=104336 RepID=UPI001D8A87F4|nr:hypothetical protein [Microbacterium foliorum]CAH0133244.1 hypothetical protein SRABI44_00287 [Microbacterium foliorum]CAH0176089.1 hypothetical protein SRABI03_01368 [Microbacterium foliorum]